MIAKFRSAVLHLRLMFLNLLGAEISRHARLSLGCKVDTTYPQGVKIGAYSFVAHGALILSHDFTRGVKLNTVIGEKCFIGVKSVILPGIKIGNNCIVGAGAIVTKDIPDGSIVVGNPAKIIKSNIKTTEFGRIIND